MALKRRLIAGSAWLTSGVAVNQLTGFVVLAVLARHISPSAFGTVAIVVVTIELTRELMLAGLPDYLVRAERWDDHVASTAFWIHLIAGLCLAALTGVCGAIVSRLVDGPLGWIFLALAPIYVLEAATATFTARMRRDLRFGAIATRSVTASVIAGVAAVAAVLAGAGLWALVVNRIIACAVNLVLIATTASWRPSRHLSTPALRTILPRSLNLAAANFLGTLNLRVVDLVVGVVGGPLALGLYQVAGRGLSIVLATVIAPSQQVALAAFTALSSRARMADGLLRILALSSLIAFPVFVGLSATSREFVSVVFGQSWSAAAEPMAILSLVGAPAVVTYLLSPVLTAVDRPRTLLHFTLAMTILNAVVALTFAPLGVSAVAAGFLGRALLGLGVALYIIRVVLNVAPVKVLTTLLPAASASVSMYLVVHLLRIQLEGLDVLAMGVSLVGAGACTYLVCLGLLWRRRVSETLSDVLRGGPTVGTSSRD